MLKFKFPITHSSHHKLPTLPIMALRVQQDQTLKIKNLRTKKGPPLYEASPIYSTRPHFTQ